MANSDSSARHFIAASNRVGIEEDITFYGHSFISNRFGDFLRQSENDETIIYADCDFGKIREARELLHFFRDRRVDTYAPLLKKTLIFKQKS